MSLGERLKAAIKTQGISQKEFARKINITEATLSRYINGLRIPDAKTIKAICETLNITSDWLLENETENKFHQIINETMELEEKVFQSNDISEETKIDLALHTGYLIGYAIKKSSGAATGLSMEIRSKLARGFALSESETKQVYAYLLELENKTPEFSKNPFQKEQVNPEATESKNPF